MYEAKCYTIIVTPFHYKKELKEKVTGNFPSELVVEVGRNSALKTHNLIQHLPLEAFEAINSLFSIMCYIAL